MSIKEARDPARLTLAGEQQSGATAQCNEVPPPQHTTHSLPRVAPPTMISASDPPCASACGGLMGRHTHRLLPMAQTAQLISEASGRIDLYLVMLLFRS